MSSPGGSRCNMHNIPDSGPRPLLNNAIPTSRSGKLPCSPRCLSSPTLLENSHSSFVQMAVSSPTSFPPSPPALGLPSSRSVRSPRSVRVTTGASRLLGSHTNSAQSHPAPWSVLLETNCSPGTCYELVMALNSGIPTFKTKTK